MNNDYDDDNDSAGFADGLTDVGFFVATLAAFAGFCVFAFLFVPPLARWILGG